MTNIVTEKTENFALMCIGLYKALQDEKEYVLSKQLLRSGTSIGANVIESNSSQSKKDFFAKICIAYKEAHETLYWLRLLERSGLTKYNLSLIKKECDEIIRILAKIKLTTEKNIKNEK